MADIVYPVVGDRGRRVRRFFETWRGRESEPLRPLDQRLSAFLASFRQLRPASLDVRPKRDLDPASLANLVQQLGQRCRVASERGDFLDVWSIAGLRDDEVRHCAVLAWILDPRSPHGLGRRILGELWSRARVYLSEGSDPQPAAASMFELGSARSVQTELVPLSHASRRIDLCVDGDDFVLIIEVKINATEGVGQLGDYLSAAEARASAHRRSKFGVLYLSERRAGMFDPRLAHARWRNVAASIRAAIDDRPRADFSIQLLRQFADRVGSFR